MSPRKIRAKANVFSTVPFRTFAREVKKPRQLRRDPLRRVAIRRVAIRRVAIRRVVKGPIKDSYIPLLHPCVEASVSFSVRSGHQKHQDPKGSFFLQKTPNFNSNCHRAGKFFFLE